MEDTPYVETTHFWAVPAIGSVHCRKCVKFVPPNDSSLSRHHATCSSSPIDDTEVDEIIALFPPSMIEEAKNSATYPHKLQQPFNLHPLPFLDQPVLGARCPEDACRKAFRSSASCNKHIRRSHSTNARAVPAMIQSFSTSSASTFSVEVLCDPQTASTSLSQLLHNRMQVIREREVDTPVTTQSKEHPNLFIKSLGFDRHLQKLSFSKVLTISARRPEAQIWMPTFKKLMADTLTYTEGLRTAPLAIMLNRRSTDLQPSKPIVGLQPETLAAYVNHMSAIFHTLKNMLDLVTEGADMPFSFSAEQAALLEALFAADPGADLPLIILRAMKALFSQPLHGDPFQSPLLSALAMLAVQRNGGGQWYEPRAYPGYMSALAKFAPLCAYQFAQGRMRNVDLVPTGLTRDELRLRYLEEEMEGTVYVRGSNHTIPMAQIHLWQGVLSDIRHQQYNPAPITWVRNTLHFKGIKVTAQDLRDIVSTGLDQLESRLKDCLFATTESPLESDIPTLPPLTAISDDPSQTTQGFNFLQHVDNHVWVNRGHEFLAQKIEQSDTLRRHFLAINVLNTSGAKSYLGDVEGFLRLLSVMVTMTSGQPPRGPEILSINLDNTTSCIRNVFVRNGRVGILTFYHKMLNKTGKTRPIWRFLPDRLGRILITYMWIVRPFAATVDILLNDNSSRQPTTLLFSTDYHWRPPSRGTDSIMYIGPDADSYVAPDSHCAIRHSRALDTLASQTQYSDDNDEENSMDISGITLDPPEPPTSWHTRILSNEMQRLSQRIISPGFTIATWRHIAIGMSRKFLRRSFPELSEIDGDQDEDSPMDLQAGHSSTIANTVYAQEFAPNADCEDVFLPITTAWHELLGIGKYGEQGGFMEETNHQSDLDIDRQADRLSSLAGRVSDDVAKLVLHNPSVSITKGQRRAFEAIFAGTGQDVVFVAPTGSGKTLIYMLPAFLEPTGITIVVCPLKALQHDQAARLRAAGITVEIWNDQEAMATAPAVVLVSPEHLTKRNWSNVTDIWRSQHKIDRVVIDEAHLVLSSSPDFRPLLQNTGALTKNLAPSRIFLSATIPSMEEGRFRSSMAITDCKFIREGTNRPNLRYRFCMATSWVDQKVIAARLVEPLQYMDKSRAVIYCQTIERCQELAGEQTWLQYYAALDDEEKTTTMQR